MSIRRSVGRERTETLPRTHKCWTVFIYKYVKCVCVRTCVCVTPISLSCALSVKVFYKLTYFLFIFLSSDLLPPRRAARLCWATRWKPRFGFLLSNFLTVAHFKACISYSCAGRVDDHMSTTIRLSPGGGGGGGRGGEKKIKTKTSRLRLLPWRIATFPFTVHTPLGAESTPRRCLTRAKNGNRRRDRWDVSRRHDSHRPNTHLFNRIRRKHARA